MDCINSLVFKHLAGLWKRFIGPYFKFFHSHSSFIPPLFSSFFNFIFTMIILNLLNYSIRFQWTEASGNIIHDYLHLSGTNNHVHHFIDNYTLSQSGYRWFIYLAHMHGRHRIRTLPLSNSCFLFNYSRLFAVKIPSHDCCSSHAYYFDISLIFWARRITWCTGKNRTKSVGICLLDLPDTQWNTSGVKTVRKITYVNL